MKLAHLISLSCCLGLTACDSINTLTQNAASTMCSRIFISNLPAQKVLDEELIPVTGGAVKWTRFDINTEDRTVTNTLLNQSSKAIYRDGLGCTLVGQVSEAELRNQYLPPLQDADLDPDLPWPLGVKGTQPLNGFNYPLFEGAVDYHFTEHGEYQIKTSAVLAAYKGKLIYEKYAPGYSADSNLQIYSVSKTITSVLTGMLSDDQLIDIHASANVDYWLPADKKEAITPHHLLTMTSGLEFNETYGDKKSDIIKVMAEDDMGAFAAAKTLAHEPGTVWNYSSGNTLILSAALKNSLGGDLSNIYEYVHNELFRKIGINSAIVQADNSGNLSLGFQTFMTPRDLSRFGQLLVQHGQWKGSRIVTTQWLDYMTTPVPLPNPYGIDYGASVYLNTVNAGNQQWPGFPEDTLTAIGYGGQFVVAIPSLELVFVRTGLTEDFIDIMPEIHQLMTTLLQSLPQ